MQSYDGTSTDHHKSMQLVLSLVHFLLLSFGGFVYGRHSAADKARYLCMFHSMLSGTNSVEHNCEQHGTFLFLLHGAEVAKFFYLLKGSSCLADTLF